jgi:hypothetical protein
MDKYELAKKMIKSTGFINMELDKTAFDNIDKIITLGDTFSLQEWKDMVDLDNEFVYCAILLSENAPLVIKMETINAIKDSPAIFFDDDIFIPILFSENRTTLENLPISVCEKLVKEIDIGSLINAINEYIVNHPDVNILPFSSTPLEPLIVSKIIYTNETGLYNQNDYETYKVIEYCRDETNLKEILNDFKLQDSYVPTAIMNNPLLSDKIKQEALESDIDIFKIHKPQKEDYINDIYRSLIGGIEVTDDQGCFATNCCMVGKLLCNNLLTPACEIDAVKRYNAIELLLIEKEMQNFLKNTKNKECLKEALSSSDNDVVCEALANPNMDISTIQNHIEKILDKEGFSYFDNMEMLAILTSAKLSKDLFEKVIQCLPNKYMAVVQEKICHNPYTPVEIMDKYLKKDTPEKMIAEFNLLARDTLSFESFQKFLTTIKVIDKEKEFIVTDEEKYTSRHSLPIISADKQFLPHYSSDDNTMLRNILEAIIEKSSNGNSQIAQIYLKILNKKDRYEKAFDKFPMCNPESFTSIMTTQNVLTDKVFCTKNRDINFRGTTLYPKDFCCNVYETYTIYKNIIDNIGFYSSILNQLQLFIDKSINAEINELNKTFLQNKNTLSER